MGRHKSAVNCNIKPWLSARPDCKEGRYIQVGNSLLLSDTFQNISAGARWLYLCMALEAGGRQTVKFSHGSAKKYGIPYTTFDRTVKILREAGFIELIEDEDHSQFRANEFRFSSQWKANPAPYFGEGKE